MAHKQLAKPTKSLKVGNVQDSAMIYGPQGQRLIPVIHNDICQAETMSAGLVVMDPLKVARPHYHRHTESILYFAEGWVVTLVGEDLEPVVHGPGDLVYIPENIIHVGVNLSDSHRVVLLEIRGDPYFTKDIVVVPEYEERVNQIAQELQKQFKNGTMKLPKNWKQRGFGPYVFEERTKDKGVGTTKTTKATKKA